MCLPRCCSSQAAQARHAGSRWKKNESKRRTKSRGPLKYRSKAAVSRDGLNSFKLRWSRTRVHFTIAAAMLSKALQRNAKHEARLSNISGCPSISVQRNKSEILRFAQNDRKATSVFRYRRGFRQAGRERFAGRLNCSRRASRSWPLK